MSCKEREDETTAGGGGSGNLEQKVGVQYAGDGKQSRLICLVYVGILDLVAC